MLNVIWQWLSVCKAMKVHLDIDRMRLEYETGKKVMLENSRRFIKVVAQFGDDKASVVWARRTWHSWHSWTFVKKARITKQNLVISAIQGDADFLIGRTFDAFRRLRFVRRARDTTNRATARAIDYVPLVLAPAPSVPMPPMMSTCVIEESCSLSGVSCACCRVLADRAQNPD